jgi:hypothetical protein
MSTKEKELNNLELLYAGIGGALVGCQIAEKWMVLCLTALFPGEPIESVEMFDQIDEQNRRKMVGRLIRELGKHVQLADEFEKLLSDFLKHRNALVHDFGRIYKDPFTAEGVTKVEEWALRTNIHAHKIIEIFTTLMHAWMRQLGISEKASIIIRTTWLSFGRQ